MAVVLKVPSEQDWGDYNSDLDQEYAHKTFAGMPLDGAVHLFARNVIERTSDLQFMPLIPFQYYIFAFRDYVLSKDALLNDLPSDTASCFLGLILLKLRESPSSIVPVMEELIPAIEYVATNQALFDAEKPTRHPSKNPHL